jgi:hypothetical protein
MSAPSGVGWLDRSTLLDPPESRDKLNQTAIEKAIGRRLDRREHRAIARTIVTFRALRVSAQDDASAADARRELRALARLPNDHAIAAALRDADDATIARVDDALHAAGALIEPTARDEADAVRRAAQARDAQGDPGGRPEAGYRIALADHARELWRLLGFDVRSRYFWWDDVQPRARGVQYKGGRRDDKAPVPRSRSGRVPASSAFAFIVALLGAIDSKKINRRSLAQALRASDAKRLRARRAGN